MKTQNKQKKTFKVHGYETKSGWENLDWTGN